jgi:hypothetical protein
VKLVLRKYVTEIVLVLLGALVSVAEALVAKRTDTALLIVFLSTLVALATAAIKHDLADQIGHAFDEGRTLAAIPDARWREEAYSELERMRDEFAGWANGTRLVREGSSLNHQISSLATVRDSVRAIHVATEAGALGMWNDRHRGFDRLVDAQRKLDARVEKRRILVLDLEDRQVSTEDGFTRLIVDPLAREVCEIQQRSPNDGGLGFELRILWIRRSAATIPSDVLILDDREVCAIRSTGLGTYSDLEVSVNASVVRWNIRTFEDLWTRSTPVQHCLAPVKQSPARSALNSASATPGP